jgi:hypothetical protein
MIFLKRLWIRLKLVMGIQNTSELLYLLLAKLLTPDTQSLLVELIKEAARLDVSSAEKKKYVLSKFGELRSELREDTLSMAINLLVEYMQARGELKHTTLDQN